MSYALSIFRKTTMVEVFKLNDFVMLYVNKETASAVPRPLLNTNGFRVKSLSNFHFNLLFNNNFSIFLGDNNREMGLKF